MTENLNFTVHQYNTYFKRIIENIVYVRNELIIPIITMYTQTTTLQNTTTDKIKEINSLLAECEDKCALITQDIRFVKEQKDIHRLTFDKITILMLDLYVDIIHKIAYDAYTDSLDSFQVEDKSGYFLENTKPILTLFEMLLINHATVEENTMSLITLNRLKTPEQNQGVDFNGPYYADMKKATEAVMFVNNYLTNYNPYAFIEIGVIPQTIEHQIQTNVKVLKICQKCQKPIRPF